MIDRELDKDSDRKNKSHAVKKKERRRYKEI